MKLRAYYSIAAFIAHYGALRAMHSANAGKDAPSADEAATLIEMERVIDELSPADRDALHEEAPPATPALPSRINREEPIRALMFDDDDAPAARSVSVVLSSGAATRHRARAELKLRRLLTARGLLTG